MKLRDLGELGLIARIERLAGRLQGSRVALGIGDDAALLRVRAGETLVLTTDACVEGVHFRFGAEAPARIGRRALLANLSDLAAMGARPLAFTLAFAAPPSLDAAVALGLVRGAVAEGAARGCPLVGGNVTRASETSLTIAAVGALAPPARALRRSAARPGDRLLVTGRLGAAALDRIRAARRGRPPRHRPEARLAAGRALARLAGAGACIDVSDGFLPDLRHLLAASGVGAEVRVDALPRAPGFEAACRRLGLDPEGLLLAGGEDYELLFTLRPGVPRAGLERRLGVAVREVGRITAGKGRLRLLGSRIRDPGRLPGWRHFAAP